ncbi:anaphase-promoting complex subunit 11 isoform X1 [Nerophis ophidion]|uniref:anaphase-promoting complex subunit 11 isoform X1 n=2 Tax=Syngnathinae TaxID=129914 RepID=UPI002ADF6C44|nr:anaphase-promoting complex subunit 11 isoform X1 [Nerophis ophidion]
MLCLQRQHAPTLSARRLGASRRRRSGTCRMKVKVKKWNGVASWLWVANDENCGICRLAFNGCCPECKVPGDDCPLVWGQCSHCFHMHCILKWLNSQQVQQQCPMCRQEWKFKE